MGIRWRRGRNSFAVSLVGALCFDGGGSLRRWNLGTLPWRISLQAHSAWRACSSFCDFFILKARATFLALSGLQAASEQGPTFRKLLSLPCSS